MKKVKGGEYDNGFMGQCMDGCMPKKDDGKKDDGKKDDVEGHCKDECMKKSMEQKGTVDPGLMDQCIPTCMEAVARNRMMNEMAQQCKMGCEAEMKKVKGGE